jgi:Flp pilus assembly protein protease CpaA
MVLTLSVMSVMAFLTIITLLTVYSFLDVRDREVKNEIVLLGLIAGCIISLSVVVCSFQNGFDWWSRCKNPVHCCTPQSWF